MVLASFLLDHIPCMWVVSCLRSLVRVPFLYPKHQPVYASFKVLSFGALVMLLDLWSHVRSLHPTNISITYFSCGKKKVCCLCFSVLYFDYFIKYCLHFWILPWFLLLKNIIICWYYQRYYTFCNSTLTDPLCIALLALAWILGIFKKASFHDQAYSFHDCIPQGLDCSIHINNDLVALSH